GDSSTNEILVGFESSSQDFGIGANGSNFMIGTSATDLDTGNLVRITSAGQVQIGSGSVAAPALSFIGDTDTGIWRPGSNQLRLATGGVDRLQIDSAGQVGLSVAPNIGSANANNTILSLKGKTAAYGANIELANFGTSGNDQTLGSIGYFDPTTAVTKNAEIEVLRESAADDAYMVFKTKPTGGTIAARMTIDSPGNVGFSRTPSANQAIAYGPSIQVGQAAALIGASSGNNLFLSSNALFDNSNWKLTNAGQAGQMFINTDGSFTFRQERTSGSANDNISWDDALTISSAGLVTSTLSSANTNTAGVALKLDHTTSGSSAVGFGTLIRFDGERTGATSDGMGTMGFVADSMSASRVDGAFVVNTGQDGAYTERLRISSTGNLSVGSGADIGGSGVATFTAAERIEMRAAGAESPQFLASCYSTTSSRCASIAFQKSHTNTGGVLDATVDGENLGRIMFRGVSSGDGARDSAEIAAVCDGGPDGSDQPAQLLFKTSSTSETIPTRMAIRSTGVVGIDNARSFRFDGTGDFAKLITNYTSAGTGQYISVADEATITLASSGGTQSALVLAYEGSNGKGGVWFVTYAGTAVLLAGTDCSATDENNKICVFKSATSHTTTFKNRLGTTLNFQIAQIGGFLG
ncbi:MAG TPA: hypothetical protein DEG65_04765, partial [Methylophaga sp.]|nr:hypothetical protein [Methylophaga sp.]